MWRAGCRKWRRPKGTPAAVKVHACRSSHLVQEVEETKEEKLKREREAREAEQRSEFEQIQEARKLLPMFPYR